MKKVIVVGGGLGGLSAAIRLSLAGFSVTVLEKEAECGGKLKREVGGAYRFDVGPSTITMLSAFEGVFLQAGKKMEDYLDFYPVDPLTRNVFHDGTLVDLTKDIDQMEAQIAAYSPSDALHYRAFLKETQKLYNISQNRFLNRLFVSWKDKLNPWLLRDFARIHPATTLDRFLRNYFSHPNTLALFGRYATYVGASPYKAPAIFAMMAHLESQLGIFGVRGGTYAIVEAFVKLAQECQVEIKTNMEVTRLLTKGRVIVGVEVSDMIYPADVVIANLDLLTAFSLLDPKKRPSMTDSKLESYEPSLSGFVMLGGVRERFDLLKHHTVFFPETYQDEFDAIFNRQKPPQDPTLYVCFSGFSDGGQAPVGGSNLFILANVPALIKQSNWQEQAEDYGDHMLSLLEQRGLTGISEHIEYNKLYTPSDWERLTGAYKGAIYGLSSNGFKQAFFRPTNRAKDLDGLWFVGGSTHPGGGTPIVTLSGQLVADAIINEQTY